MRLKLLLSIFLGFHPLLIFCQSDITISGKVLDDLTSEPLAGANVKVLNTGGQTFCDAAGRFTIKLPGRESAQLEITYVGYHSQQLEWSFDQIKREIVVRLVMADDMSKEAVVTASRHNETLTQAPASIRVVGSRELRKFAGSNVFALLGSQPGIDVVRSGVDGISINARGLNYFGNTKVFLLVDNRNSMTPISSGVAVWNNMTVQKDDIERMEVVLGPNAAIYGPNVHNAMVNVITRHPRQSEGTTIAVGAGNRYQFSGRLRHAVALSKRWAIKISGEYSSGKEFVFYDSVYAGGGIFGPRVAIPERNVDFDFRHIRGEGHIYYQAGDKTEMILSGGISDNNFLGLTGAGRNQTIGQVLGFFQARLVHPRFFVNAYYSDVKLGKSYAIANYTRDFWNRTHSILSTGPNRLLPPDSAEMFALRPGNSFVEESGRWNVEAQFNQAFEKQGLLVIAALNFQQENPDGKGVGLIDELEPIEIKQWGGALLLEKKLPWQMKLTAAARLDYHSNFQGMFAPKLALMKKVAEGWARLSWSKAYTVPTIFMQYAKGAGIVFGNGNGVTYIPNGKPADDPVFWQTTTRVSPQFVNTFEAAYKGNLGKRWFADVCGWYSVNEKFFTPGLAVSGRALAMGEVPVIPANPGLVVNDTLRGAGFNTYFNYGKVRTYGLDALLAFRPFTNGMMTAGYSWQGSDIDENNLENDANKDGWQSAEERSLNAPEHKFWLGLSFSQLWHKRLSVDLRMRYVSQYDFYSANQIATASGEGRRGIVYMGPANPPALKNFDHGPLGGFTSVDFNASCRLNSNSLLSLTVSNLFNIKQREAPGSPSIGRLMQMEYRVVLPAKWK